MKIKNKQKSGSDSNNFQAGGNLTVTNYFISPFQDIGGVVQKTDFKEASYRTKNKIKANQKSFEEQLSLDFSKIRKNKGDLLKIIYSPDFQFIIKKAIIEASRSDSNDLHGMLSSLIINRINNDEDDLKRIVYNEAIMTVSKLTKDQLKIITLCFLICEACDSDITSWDEYKYHIDAVLKNFTSFKNTRAEFLHIEYAGLGSQRTLGGFLTSYQKNNYPFLFFKPVNKEDVQKISANNDLINELFILDKSQDKYFFKIRNETELSHIIQKYNIEQENQQYISSLYKMNNVSEDEVAKNIEKQTMYGKELIDMWNKSGLVGLKLTSVGILIASIYYEQVMGHQININHWIN
jgi:hypothetical protein